jgi:hypothetical protein
MTKLNRNLLALAIAAVFSFSAAAASACDGMKDHASAGGDTQAKNETGGKAPAKTKNKSGATKSRSDESGNKS